MKLFISYAHDDEFLVRTQIVEILDDGGHEPWFDHDLIPGKDWQTQLLDAIIICEAFVYAMTPRSLESEWCLWEYGQAVRLGKPIMPVLLVNAQIPQQLDSIQYVDFTQGATGHTVARLMKGLQVIDRSLVMALPTMPTGAPAQAVPDSQGEIDQLHSDLRAAQEQIKHLQDNHDVDKALLQAMRHEVGQRNAQIQQIEIELEAERLREVTPPYEQHSIFSQSADPTQPAATTGSRLQILKLHGFNPLNWFRLYHWLFFQPSGLLDHRVVFGKAQERGSAAWLASTLALLPLFIPTLAANIGTLRWYSFATDSHNIVLILIIGLWLTSSTLDNFSHHWSGWIGVGAFIVASVLAGTVALSVAFGGGSVLPLGVAGVLGGVLASIVAGIMAFGAALGVAGIMAFVVAFAIVGGVVGVVAGTGAFVTVIVVAGSVQKMANIRLTRGIREPYWLIAALGLLVPASYAVLVVISF